jgi:hypothetical protein
MEVKMNLVVVGAALAALTAMAHGAPVTITYMQGVDGYISQQDTELKQTDPDTVQNAAGAVYVEVYAPDTESINKIGRRGVYAFGNLPLPANVRITSATLGLMGFWASDSNSDGNVDMAISTLLVPFDEASATWNVRSTGVLWNTPGAGATTDTYAFDQGFDRHTAETWTDIATNSFSTPHVVNFDVTASLQAQYDAGKYYGWMVGDTNINDGRVGFRDHEIGGTNRPVLTVTYDSVPEPAALSLLGAFGGAVLFRRRHN